MLFVAAFHYTISYTTPETQKVGWGLSACLHKKSCCGTICDKTVLYCTMYIYGEGEKFYKESTLRV